MYECLWIESYLHIYCFKVWVLDATPGKVRAGGDGEDHPAELISFLSTLPKEVVDLQFVHLYLFFNELSIRQIEQNIRVNFLFMVCTLTYAISCLIF